MNDSSTLAEALDWASHATPVFPCRSNKAPYTPRGFLDASLDPDQVRAWWTEYPEALLGVPTGSASMIVVIDMDVDKGKGLDGVAAFADLLRQRDITLRTRQHSTPRGGIHLLFQHPGEKVKCTTGRLVAGVDTRGDGGYVIMPPSRNGAAAYTVACDAHVERMPESLIQLLREKGIMHDPDAEKPKPEIRIKAEPEETPDREKVEAALNHVCADCDFNTWLQVGMALHSWKPTEGVAMWDAWSQSAPDRYEEAAIQRHAKTFESGGGVTIATLFKLAIDHGWQPPRGLTAREETRGAELAVPAAKKISRSVDTFPLEEVRWLWPGRFAMGKVSMLSGDPGTAKSHLCLDIAARVSQGTEWPDKSGNAPSGKVIILSAEDDVSDTIRPRLEAAGANLSNVFIFPPTYPDHSDESRIRAFSLAHDLASLEGDIIQTAEVRLLIIDPISAYLSDVDSHNNSDIRTLLVPVADMAARHDVAVICVSHLNKGHGGKAMYRTSGTLAFVAAARAVWVVAKDEEDPERRLLLPVKNNLAREQNGLAYALTDCLDCPGMARIKWEPDPVDVTADEAVDPDQREDRFLWESAADWLKVYMEDGPLPTKEVLKAGKAEEFSEKTIRMAARKIGIESSRKGFGRGAVWFWGYPSGHFTDSQSPIDS